MSKVLCLCSKHAHADRLVSAVTQAFAVKEYDVEALSVITAKEPLSRFAEGFERVVFDVGSDLAYVTQGVEFSLRRLFGDLSTIAPEGLYLYGYWCDPVFQAPLPPVVHGCFVHRSVSDSSVTFKPIALS